MNRKPLICAAAAGLLSLAGTAASQSPAPAIQPIAEAHPTAETLAGKYVMEQAGRQLGRAFNNPASTSKSRSRLLDPSYTQHNPMWKRIDDLNDTHGIDGFVLGMNHIVGGEFAHEPRAQQSPSAAAAHKASLLLADGKFVASVNPHQLADPANPGKFYQAYYFDVFRMENGKLAEHWDDALIPPNPPDYFKIPLPVEVVKREIQVIDTPDPPPVKDDGSSAAPPPPADALAAKYAVEQANKKLALAFLDPSSTMKSREALMTSDYVQHSPMWNRIDDLNNVRGVEGFRLGMNLLFGGEFPKAEMSQHLVLLIADGDKVIAVTSYQRPDSAYPGKTSEAFYFDAWRVENGRLAEHWDDILIPENPPDYIKVPLSATLKRGVEIAVRR